MNQQQTRLIQLNLATANPSDPVFTHDCAYINAADVILVRDVAHHILAGATRHVGAPSTQEGVEIHSWCEVYLRGHPHSITFPYPADVLIRALDLLQANQ